MVSSWRADKINHVASKIGKMLIPPKIVNAVSTKSTAAIFSLSLPLFVFTL